MKTIVFIILFLLAFAERTAFDLGPNVELVTMAMIISSFYLGRNWSLWLVFLIMAASDLFIGTTSIFLFTWSGFLIPTVFISQKLKSMFAGTIIGLGSNLFFYIWTNFGVWLLDSWGMYSRDLAGLTMSYINGLPFLKLQLLSTLLFVPLGLLVVEFVSRFSSLTKHLYLYKLLNR